LVTSQECFSLFGADEIVVRLKKRGGLAFTQTVQFLRHLVLAQRLNVSIMHHAWCDPVLLLWI